MSAGGSVRVWVRAFVACMHASCVLLDAPSDMEIKALHVRWRLCVCLRMFLGAFVLVSVFVCVCVRLVCSACPRSTHRMPDF